MGPKKNFPASLNCSIHSRITMREFFFPQTLGRLAYLFRHLPLNAFSLVQMSHFGTVNEWTLQETRLAGLVLLTLAYGVMFVYLPRIRDCGMSNWTLLLALIPYISNLLGLILFFKPSAVLQVGMRSMSTIPATGTKCCYCGRALPTDNEGAVSEGLRKFCSDCSTIPPAVPPSDADGASAKG